MTRGWHEERPELAEEIRADLLARYPTLHLFIQPGGKAEVRGTFPIRSVDGRELDQYQVSIEIPAGYPRDLPILRELGGRIPWKSEFHVEEDGKACVLLPDDRWRSFPEGAPFQKFLDGPVHDFFLGQSLVARGEKWPFGQWDHGAGGILQYYREVLKTDDDLTAARFLWVLCKLNLKESWECPCGSGRKIRSCCKTRIVDLRQKIPSKTAQSSFEKLQKAGLWVDLYKGAKLRVPSKNATENEK